MCAMFFRIKKKAEKEEKLVTRPVGVRDKTGLAYLTCSWTVNINGEVLKISFSRDTCCVYLDGEPIETEMLIKDRGYDIHIWWEDRHGRFYIFSDVDVDKSQKPMVNYLYIDGSCVSTKNYKEHKRMEKVPANLPKRAIDIYMAECKQEEDKQIV